MLTPQFDSQLAGRRVFLILNQVGDEDGQTIRSWFLQRFEVGDSTQSVALHAWGNISVTELLPRRHAPR